MNTRAVQESKNHGLTDFPYSIYHVLMPEYLTEFPLHFHDEIEIIPVLKGKVEFNILGEKVIANEGDIAIILPNYPHCMKQLDGLDAEYYCILFKLDILKRNDNETIYNRIVPPIYNHKVTFPLVLKHNDDLCNKIYPICKELISYWSRSYDSCAFSVLGDLYRIIGTLWDYRQSSENTELNNHKSYQRIKEAIYAVQNRYEKPLSVDEMASLCSMSSSHFMKLFREVIGDSFNNFLINYRLQMAAKKLKESDDKIVNISEDCGFNTPSYFARAFAKTYKMSPAEYRKAQSNK